MCLREDLLYRLAVFPIIVPPLRERGDDVLLLANHFLDELNERSGTRKRFAASALATIESHTWPGNVRELKNAVERAFILSDDVLELELLPVQPTSDSEVGMSRWRAGALRHDARGSGAFADRGHPVAMPGKQNARGTDPGLQPEDAL